uniref:Dual specificity phosphatase catalytic domain-containing protein n=1 Tax=viral metagenome TaxID=1070528 RepID=A0A6C0CCY8_9ZZZZ
MLYTEVLSGLWIGDIDIMYNKKFIEDNQIKLIINCTIDYKFSEHKDVQNIRIPLPNNLYNSIDTIKQNKDKILNFIDSNLEDHHILICCVDGTNISPFIASLYLVKYGEIDKSEIKKIIQSKNKAVSMDFDLGLLDL